MDIVDKMCSVYICFFLSFVVLGAEITVYTIARRDYIIIPNLKKPISDRFISFKVKTYGNSYISLMSDNTDDDPLYEIVIPNFFSSTSYMWIGTENSAPILCENMQNVVNCFCYADFFIAWNDTTVTLGQDEINGPFFLTCTSSTKLWPIFNVGIRTTVNGNWTFYTSDIPTTSDEATVQPKRTTIGDLLIPTDVTRHQQITSANYLSTISEGTSIRLQTYTSTEKLTMYDETTDLPHTTRPADRTTASNDLQSRLTNDNSARNDNSAVSTSTKSTTITSVHITSPLHIPISETCACYCPKASFTPSDNVLVTQLRIDKKTLSSYKRRQQSATDPRKSSFYIGCVGITVFSVTVGFIVLLDFLPRA